MLLTKTLRFFCGLVVWITAKSLVFASLWGIVFFLSRIDLRYQVALFLFRVIYKYFCLFLWPFEKGISDLSGWGFLHIICLEISIILGRWISPCRYAPSPLPKGDLFYCLDKITYSTWCSLFISHETGLV